MGEAEGTSLKAEGSCRVALHMEEETCVSLASVLGHFCGERAFGSSEKAVEGMDNSMEVDMKGTVFGLTYNANDYIIKR